MRIDLSARATRDIDVRPQRRNSHGSPICHASERGFAVAEVLVALLLVVAIGFVTLAIVQAFTRAISMRSSGDGGAVALEAQIEKLRADAATSFAVFVPKDDVFHAVNAAAPSLGAIPSGHEVDFYARTDTGAETWWAYRYDAKAGSLQRFDYDGAGHVGVADRDTGAIDTGAHYPALTGVLNFSAQVFEADQLTNSKNAFAPLITQLTNGAGVAARAEPVGFVPTSGVARSDLYGGNVTVQIQLQTQRGSRTVHLESAALPSGFTIHMIPSIRAVTYRIDIVHRFWFGFAQITHSQIFNQLLYSYDSTAAPSNWKAWCDWELYGSKTAGLSIGSPYASYRPNDFNESAPGIYYAVTATGPHGNGTTGLNEQPGCNRPVPGPTSTPPPIQSQPDPDTNDTPPPCFVQGRCWPMSAPANFTPPSPWPSSSPPAYWCATHQQSPLCGGAGGTPVPIYGTPPPPDTGTPSPGSSSSPIPRFPLPPHAGEPPPTAAPILPGTR